MRPYEIAFIVHPDLDEAPFNEVVERVKSWVIDSEGKVNKVDLWGKRKMAYRIRKQSEGQYVILHAEIPTSAVAEMERNLRLHESVIRFMVTTVEPAAE